MHMSGKASPPKRRRFFDINARPYRRFGRIPVGLPDGEHIGMTRIAWPDPAPLQFLQAVVTPQKCILEQKDGIIVGHSRVHLSEELEKRAKHFELLLGFLPSAFTQASPDKVVLELQ